MSMGMNMANASSRDTATSGHVERLWSTRDVADFFGVTVGTVGIWEKTGKIPPGKKIGRGARWDGRAIRKLAGL
jgi:hypothetical protein